MTYHGKKQLTDLVRRRRWYRKARLNTKGPWQEVGQTKIIDISVQSFTGSDLIVAWAISSAGDLLFRQGITQAMPAGSSWEHIKCDPLISISCSDENKVWAVAKSGSIFFRVDVTFENPIGSTWKRIDSPSNMQFKQISAGMSGVWALDSQSRLSVRCGINSERLEGTHWQLLPNIPNDPPNLEDDVNIGYKCISVGKVVMVISNSGFVCKRNGITKENPIGTGWDLGVKADWNWLCVNSY
jgi:tectonin beta-propeller repeat-containing protein 1